LPQRSESDKRKHFLSYLKQSFMKKFSVLSIFIFLFSFASSAQEQYVEVIVKDTMMVEPQRWILFVNIEKEYDYTARTDTAAMTDTVAARSIFGGLHTPKLKEGTPPDELKALARKLNGKVLDDISPLQYSRRGRESDNSNYFSAEFSSRKSMEEFSKAAIKHSDVNITISGTFNSELERFKGLLDAKLINSAKQKATRLAELSGRKTGSIILVSEATASESNTLQDLIETIIKYDGAESRRLAMMNLFPDKIKIEKALKVRVALQ
jgi:hypothetical protein